MWPFRKKVVKSGVKANSVRLVDGVTEVDVCGLTCPGYLLAINKAVDALERNSRAKLLITYPPCVEDIKAWCKEKEIEFLGLTQGEGVWVITIEKS